MNIDKLMDVSEYLDLTNRMKITENQYPQLFMHWHDESWPAQEILVKCAKNRAWTICRASINYDDKSFHYEVAINSDLTDQRSVSYDEICKDFGWKSFKFSHDFQTIVFKK